MVDLNQVREGLREIDIRPACEQHIKDIGLDPEDQESATFQNLQARERTQVLMDLANREAGIVVGTSDLSELALGFATFGGDHIAMYGETSREPKTLVQMPSVPSRVREFWISRPMREHATLPRMRYLMRVPWMLRATWTFIARCSQSRARS